MFITEAILCLALNVYHEAKNQPFIGQVAVAQVHLENSNLNGATILYGEALGRLKKWLIYLKIEFY